jgi:replicative DNA helicase
MPVTEQQLPCDLAAERLILGSVILDHTAHLEVFSLLKADDFSLNLHQKLYSLMVVMDADGETIDRITIASRLNDLKLLEAIGGFSYLISLDEGLPELPSIESYIRIVIEKSSLRKIIYTAQNLMNRCMAADGDAAELIASADQHLMQINRNEASTAEALNAGQIVSKVGGLDKFIDPDPGVSSPWVRLNDITGGYRLQELCVVAGNPGMGKSAIAIQTGMRVAEDGRGVMIFSLEMSRASIVKRMACYRARVDAQKLQLGYLNMEERARLRVAINDITKWPLWIAEYGISTVSGIRAALRAKRAAKQEVFMIVIDYLQILQVVGKSKSRNEEVSELTRSLKLLAMEEKVNIQLLSQLSRDNKKERRPPELQDLRDSGSIEQDADSVAFVWRPELMWREKPELKGLAELILAKQRNGPTGKIELTWVGAFVAFENRTEDFREE